MLRFACSKNNLRLFLELRSLSLERELARVLGLACRSVTGVSADLRHREKYFRLGPARSSPLEPNGRGNYSLHSNHVFRRQLESLESLVTLSKLNSSSLSSLASHASSARSHPPASAQVSSQASLLSLVGGGCRSSYGRLAS